MRRRGKGMTQEETSVAVAECSFGADGTWGGIGTAPWHIDSERGRCDPNGAAGGGDQRLLRMATSSGVREKPKMSMFCSMRSGRADLGITMTPVSMCQRRTTWAGLTWYLAAISPSARSRSLVPLSGL